MNPYVSTFFTLALIHRAHSRNSLTPPAILAATITALIHASHPTALPFTLLITFYLLGNTATKIKKHEKEKLTVSSTGGHGHEGQLNSGRGVAQVIANSGFASILAVVDLGLRKGWFTRLGLGHIFTEKAVTGKGWFGGETGWMGDVLIMGIIANYSATTADTLGSELGILSKSKPRLILNPFKECAPGTNGGVSLLGLLSGTIGSLFIAGISSYWLNPTYPTSSSSTFTTPSINTSTTSLTVSFLILTTALGLTGSIIDSLLGALFQFSVLDLRTNLIVENPHGGTVLVIPGETSFHPQHHIAKGTVEIEKVGGEGARGDLKEQKANVVHAVGGKGVGGASRKIIQGGLGWLDNNGVNATMAGMMSMLGMVAWELLVQVK